MNNLVARLSSLKQSDRLRVFGIAVLGLGIAAACVFYLIESRVPVLDLGELLPGYSRAEARQIAALMGHFGLLMVGWVDALDRPGPKAVGIAVGSALVTLVCFRAAHVMDYNEQAREEP